MHTKIVIEKIERKKNVKYIQNIKSNISRPKLL